MKVVSCTYTYTEMKYIADKAENEILSAAVKVLDDFYNSASNDGDYLCKIADVREGLKDLLSGLICDSNSFYWAERIADD